MDLSIVIPTYNEEDKIEKDILSASQFLTKNNLTGEIIIVDDGSFDNTSQKAEDTPVPNGIEKTVIKYNINKGKGHAVRTGISNTKGQFVVMSDAGSCTKYESALPGIDLIKKNRCHIANGSRKLKDSIIIQGRPLSRKIISWLFRQLTILYLKIPRSFTDTQCGFKIYKGDIARELYAECLFDGLVFDIEVLVRALQKGYQIKEIPIEWKNDPDSRVFPLRMCGIVLHELIQIRKILK